MKFSVMFTFKRVVLVVCVAVMLGMGCGPSRSQNNKQHLQSIPANPHIRVCIESSASALNINLAGNYQVLAGYSEQVLGRGSLLRAATVKADANGIRIGSQHYTMSFVRLRSAGRAIIAVNGKEFRGEIHLHRQTNNQLKVINFLDLESYLYGVIGSEMPASWPDAALQAQAIAARTWAINRIMLKESAEFDVYNDQRSQMYKGVDGETRKVRYAVDSTRGQILTYKAKLFSAYFHSYCGGHTESALNVFGEDLLEPLVGVRCRYCSEVLAPEKFTWRKQFKQAEFSQALKSKKKIRKVEMIRFEQSRSVHVQMAVIYHDRTITKIPALELRRLLRLRSTGMSAAKVSGDKINIMGTGYGHGVGMCQWGAYGLSLNNKSYAYILAFYYPGANIIEVPSF